MKKLILLLLLSTFLQAENIAVVISKNFNADKLSKSQIKRLFLAKTNRINNTKVKIVELQDTKYKQKFYKKVSGKSKAQLRSYWTTLIFTGKAKPPKQIKTLQELLIKMKKNKNIITYIPENQVTQEMKVLYTMSE